MFAEKVIQYCIGLSLILLMITYFLGENGRISYFPSYIIGIAGLGLGLLGRFNTFIQSTLFTSILLTTMLGYLCISILALGGGISTSLLYFGYSLLILSFVYGLVYSCLNMEWFRNVFLST
ncbi:MAG: hypothetical protein ACI8W1_002480, partial [Candidatus Azotimanducaceae bacterium]